MFNLTSPEAFEAFKVLMINYSESEKLVVDAMEGRLSPNQVEQVLGIFGVSSPEEALRVIRNQRNSLVRTVVVNEH